uniref:Crystallin, gamma N1 n=1 Tax=Callorhinchus milii TaxID=7868 RepID=A0A4W3HN25_CALMI
MSQSHNISSQEFFSFLHKSLEVYGDCDNFQDKGFMNRVNSIRVESSAWICYDHPDFKGQQYILERGEYPEFHRWNAHNDHMGSCKPVRMHGEHYRIELFDTCNFTGQCMEFCEDCPFLQGRGWNKTCVNSLKVYGDGARWSPHSHLWGGESKTNGCTRGPMEACQCDCQGDTMVKGVDRHFCNQRRDSRMVCCLPGTSSGAGGICTRRMGYT